MDTPYDLTINPVQADILAHATDLYTRIQCGQFQVVLDEFRHRPGVSVEAIQEAEELIGRVKLLLTGLPTNASHGIYSPKNPETARVAYDIHQVIRHRLAHDRDPEGKSGGIWRTPPHATSEQPLARMAQAKPPETEDQ